MRFPEEPQFHPVNPVPQEAAEVGCTELNAEDASEALQRLLGEGFLQDFDQPAEERAFRPSCRDYYASYKSGQSANMQLIVFSMF